MGNIENEMSEFDRFEFAIPAATHTFFYRILPVESCKEVMRLDSDCREILFYLYLDDFFGKSKIAE